jgi:hypothetical protein
LTDKSGLAMSARSSVSLARNGGGADVSDPPTSRGRPCRVNDREKLPLGGPGARDTLRRCTPRGRRIRRGVLFHVEGMG